MQNNPSALVCFNDQVQAKHIFSKHCLFIAAFSTVIKILKNQNKTITPQTKQQNNNQKKNNNKKKKENKPQHLILKCCAP